MPLTPNWREWYHLQHRDSCHSSGSEFEQYVTKVLTLFHDDFLNPAPAGTFGDGGCDGLAEAGKILYACYGQRPGRDAERETRNKIKSDFARALDCWSTFDCWRFVTNAPIGRLSLEAFNLMQEQHADGSSRPVIMRIWNIEKLWIEVVGKLDLLKLDSLFPGAPGIANIELSDLLPLFESLDTDDSASFVSGEIRPVPEGKMDYNALPDLSRLEFNYGRLMAYRIDSWYAKAAEPDLRDKHGERFRAIYLEASGITSEPSEILERLYVSLAGENFRLDGKRANAVYAVVSYFFDSCHIFREPPATFPEVIQ